MAFRHLGTRVPYGLEDDFTGPGWGVGRVPKLLSGEIRVKAAERFSKEGDL
jgi:hypothetical protein